MAAQVSLVERVGVLKAKCVMVQGTASSAGKSMLATALCRLLRQDGWRVAPFKAQNMALNSFVSGDGGEIGRSQAVQAAAAGVDSSVDMNPILLKPEAGGRCQLVVRGKPRATLSVNEYYDYQGTLWPIVQESLSKLRSQFEVVVIEGAGSPAEVNLREQDIVNMRVAKSIDASVLLVGDIDRGGVFASLVGTLELLEPAERALVKAMVINKFRGDLGLLRPGLDFLERRTGIPVAGVIPYVADLSIAQEDSVCLDGRHRPDAGTGLLDVGVVRLPHLANSDDFDPLVAEPGVTLRFVARLADLGHTDLLILPGTKATMADLLFLRRTGWDQAIMLLARTGTPIIGICGGYQLLGRTLRDPLGVESTLEEAEGLGLLPVDTTFTTEKRTCRVRGRVLPNKGVLSLVAGEEIEGFEIHLGYTSGASVPAIRLTAESGEAVEAVDGAVSVDGNVVGTHLHGLFDRAGFRHGLLRWLAERKGVQLPSGGADLNREREYDRLASVVRESLNLPLVYRLIGLD